MINILTLGNHLSLSILIRLPGTHLNKRLVSIAEVNHQEEIAFVTVAVGVPELLERNAIDIIVFGMLYDFDVLEFHVDILRILEHTLQIVEIFLLPPYR